MNNMTNQLLVKNPKVIRIPKNTLVLLCGAQDSGKSTLWKKHFDVENVVCTDDLFIEVYNSCKFLLNSNSDTFNTILKTADTRLRSKVTELASKRDYVVIDAISPAIEQRLEVVTLFKDYFENIIQIVIMPEWRIIENRKPKTLLPEKAQFHMRVPTKQEVKLIYDSIKILINTGEISIGPDITYVLTNHKIVFKFD